jgi:hypothetical protein
MRDFRHAALRPRIGGIGIGAARCAGKAKCLHGQRERNKLGSDRHRAA